MGLFGSKKAKKESRMQLRGFPGDSSTHKCLLMAAEKGVPLDMELLDVMGGACDRQDYRAISPFGKCPCLTEDDFVTTGAPAILAYLDVRGQGGPLNPKKAAFYGEQNYWVQLGEKLAEPSVTSLMWENVCAPMSDSSYTAEVGEVAAARDQLEQVLDALDAQLDGRNFIIGEYSYADVHWTVIAHLCTLSGEQDLIDSRSNVKAWFDRVQERISFASLPSIEDVKHKQLRSVA
jgi:glutathione S-transferase